MKNSIGKQIVRAIALALICGLIAAAACSCAPINGSGAQSEKAKINMIAGTWQLEDDEDTRITFGRDGSFDNGERSQDGYTAKFAFKKMMVVNYEDDGYPETILTLIEVGGNTLKVSYSPEEERVLKRAGGKAKKADSIVGKWTADDYDATYTFAENGRFELKANGEVVYEGTYEIKEVLSMLFYYEDGELFDMDAVFYELSGNKLTLTEIDYEGNPDTEDYWVFKRVK